MEVLRSKIPQTNSLIVDLDIFTIWILDCKYFLRITQKSQKASKNTHSLNPIKFTCDVT